MAKLDDVVGFYGGKCGLSLWLGKTRNKLKRMTIILEQGLMLVADSKVF